MNTVIIGRYRVVAVIGKGSFSRVFQCLDLQTTQMVSVKVVRNEKDCFDAGLGEIKVWRRAQAPSRRRHALRLAPHARLCDVPRAALTPSRAPLPWPLPWKVLALLAKDDPEGQQARLRLLDYFYYKASAAQRPLSSTGPPPLIEH